MILPLDLSEKGMFHLGKRPHPHNDPFDRILVWEAIENVLTILTPDPLIKQYPIRHFWQVMSVHRSEIVV
jgi:PIN domain nuclease of toxin-antitoxin system